MSPRSSSHRCCSCRNTIPPPCTAAVIAESKSAKRRNACAVMSFIFDSQSDSNFKAYCIVSILVTSMQLILGGRIFVAVIEDLLAKGMRNAQNVFQGVNLEMDDCCQWVRSRLQQRGCKPFEFVKTALCYDPSQSNFHGSFAASPMAEADITAMKETHRAQQTPLQQLHAELDQEKEASATAASEAMDMILRLQGKKAAVKMEASHYKRMAEEKIGHAEETLEVFEELIYQKEMEITALEVQVLAYKQKLLALGVDINISELEFPHDLLLNRSK
ncbi:hypothetical protein HN873_048205 [Arachis hypogaea]